MNMFKGVTFKGFLKILVTVYVPLFVFIFFEGFIVKVIQFLSDLLRLDRFGTVVFAWALFVVGGIIWGAIEFRATEVGQKFPDPLLNGIAWLLKRKSVAIKALTYVVSMVLIGAVTVPPLKSADLPHKRLLSVIISVVYACIWVPSFFAIPIPGIK